jgi:hypothetical protein
MLVMAAFSVTTLVVGSFMLRARPAWWRELDPADTALAARALALENGLVSVLSAPRPAGTEWTAAINAADASAWLVTRLPRWLASQAPDLPWPSEVKQVQVGFEGETVTIGAKLVRDGAEQFLAVEIEPLIAGQGSLWTPAKTIDVGRLRLPAALILDGHGQPAAWGSRLVSERDVPANLRELPQTAALARALAGEAPAVQNASLRLQDGRRVRLLGVRAQGGQLLLTCRTEPR